MSLKEQVLTLAEDLAQETKDFGHLRESAPRAALVEALDAADAELFDMTSMYNRCVDDVHTLREENTALRLDAERYRWLHSNAYVGIAPHPKPHEVWCIRLPNPNDCANLDQAIDAARAALEQSK